MKSVAIVVKGMGQLCLFSSDGIATLLLFYGKSIFCISEGLCRRKKIQGYVSKHGHGVSDLLYLHTASAYGTATVVLKRTVLFIAER